MCSQLCADSTWHGTAFGETEEADTEAAHRYSLRTTSDRGWGSPKEAVGGTLRRGSSCVCCVREKERTASVHRSQCGLVGSRESRLP